MPASGLQRHAVHLGYHCTGVWTRATCRPAWSRRDDCGLSVVQVWIAGVNLPQQLVTAHREGDLVLFVGAGASMGAPSNLPSFRQLADALAGERLADPAASDDDRLDDFLGRLDDEHGGDVHTRVRAHIERPGSLPNGVHAGVAALALAAPVLRVVTTNYDMHLSSAFAAAHTDVPEYLAPALPLGDDFDGLVYLHGKVEQPPHRLVVTDRDFGRAYLTDAWAARFLERMFGRFPVLFIGYSHSDVVMSYLARGLRENGPPRYALTDDPHNARWHRLRIHPVEYRNDDGAHKRVPALLHEWAEDASRGLLDHRQRLAELTQAPPSGVPEEESYLEDTLTDLTRTGLFVELARGLEWLRWLTTRPQFRPLVDDTVEATEATRKLAYWVAEHYVAHEQHTADALGVIADAGGRLAPPLWQAVAHWLHITGEPRPDWLDRWVPVLAASAPRYEQGWLAYALGASQWPSQRASILLLLEHLTDPQSHLRATLGLQAQPSMDVPLRDDHADVRLPYDAVVKPHLDDLGREVLVIAERHLIKAHAMLAAFGVVTPTWDPLSFHRSAIQPHPQDAYPQPIDLVVDAARDALDAIAAQAPTSAAATLSAWSQSPAALLRRLAVHGYAQRADLQPDDKVRWLITQGWLFDISVRQEAFRLLEFALPHCSEAAVSQLVGAIRTPPSDGQEPHARTVYDLLGWVARHALANDTARVAFDQVQSAHPDWLERAHPGFVAWHEGGFIGPQPPLPAEELVALLRADPKDAVDRLLAFERADTPWDGPTWDDAAALLAEVVKADPDLGHIVLASAEHHDGLVSATARGWASAELDDDRAAAIARRLRDTVRAGTVVALAGLLAGSGTGQAGPEWHTVPEARELARLVWAEQTAGPAAELDVDSTLGHAINHPAGHLALFWARAVAADWRGAGEAWTGLTAELREPLETMLTGDGTATALAEIVLASQVLLIYGADSTWCTAHVLPLLSWDEPVRAARTWNGYLTWGRANDQLLQAGLLEQYLRCVEHAASLREDLQRQLVGHLAAIALFTSIDPLTWTGRLTVSGSPELRMEWLTGVANALLDLDAVAVEAQWQRWLRRYWSDRVAGVPRHLTPEEAGAIAAWALALDKSVAEAVQLAVSVPVRVGPHIDVMRRMTPERLARSPGGWTTLLAHLLRGADSSFYDCHRLRRLVSDLRATGADVTALLEQGIRLGCGAMDS